MHDTSEFHIDQEGQTWGMRADDVREEDFAEPYFAQYGKVKDARGQIIPRETLDKILSLCCHIRGMHEHHQELLELLDIFVKLVKPLGKSKANRAYKCKLKMPFPIAWPSAANFPADRA